MNLIIFYYILQSEIDLRSYKMEAKKDINKKNNKSLTVEFSQPEAESSPSPVDGRESN